MKKFVDPDAALNELRHVIEQLINQKNRRNLYIFIGMLVVIVAVLIGVIFWFFKKDDDFEDDWDYDWDEDDDENEIESAGECCCSDKDVDNSSEVTGF